MENRAQADIDLSAIAFNIQQLTKLAGVPIMAVVKADAYGHGLVPVARTALNAGATWLGVALLEEALALRAAEITEPILAWLVPPSSDFARAIDHDIDLAVPSLRILGEIREASRRLGKRARIHIEIDTGMTRGGFLDEWDELIALITNDLTCLPEIEVVGLFSHFARADEPGQAQNARQLKRFVEMLDDLNRIGVVPAISHLSNSAATISDASSHFDLVRIGIAMYGLTPDLAHLGNSQSLGLRPAMTVRAKLHLVKDVSAGMEVGYGALGKTEVDTRLGIVAMGYADGIPRISEGAGIFVDGKRAPIIGRISMDQFVVDLGKNSTAQAGEWVIIFGPGDAGEYSADDWGAASQSINYEIVTRIGPRIPRVYSTTSRSIH